MNKTFTFLFATLMVCAFAFVGCKKDSPRAYADKYYNAIKHQNYKTVIDMMPDSKDLSDEEKDGIAEMMKMFYEIPGGIKDYEIVSEEISDDGNSATVTVKITYGTGDVDEDVTYFTKTKKGWQPVMPGEDEEIGDLIDADFDFGDYLDSIEELDEVEE